MYVTQLCFGHGVFHIKFRLVSKLIKREPISDKDASYRISGKFLSLIGKIWYNNILFFLFFFYNNRLRIISVWHLHGYQNILCLILVNLLLLLNRYIEVFKSNPDEFRRGTNSPRSRGMNRPGPYDRYTGGGPGGGFSRGGRMRNSGFERRSGGGGGGYGGKKITKIC